MPIDYEVTGQHLNEAPEIAEEILFRFAQGHGREVARGALRQRQIDEALLQ